MDFKMSATGDMRLMWTIVILSVVLPASCLDHSSVDFDFHKSIKSCQDNVCGGALQSTKVSDPFTNCRCDGDCVKYGDCCYGAPIFSLKEEPKPAFVCVDLQVRAVYMKTECPDHLRESDIGKSCRDPSMADPYLTLPVTNNKTFTTYRNSFCAVCNNEIDFIFWNFNLYVLDSESDSEDLVLEEAVKDLKFNSTLNSWGFQIESTFQKVYLAPSTPADLERSIRQCKPNVISSCAGDWRNSALEKLCNSYTYIVHDSRVSFRNPHCAECNNVPLGNLSCIDTSTRFGFNDIHVLDHIFKINEKEEFYDYFGKAYIKREDILLPFLSESHSICSKIVIKSGNYKYVNNTEIIIPRYDKKFKLFEADLTKNGDLLICSEAFGVNYKNEISIDDFGNKVISLLGYTLSIILLTVHLIVFIVNHVKTGSKCYIASLSLSLLVAYTTLLIGNSFSGNSCYIISVVSCYSLLASFFWMFIISYDCWRLVRSADKCLIEQNENKKARFALYSLWSWSSPALLVGAAILLDNSSITPIDWKPLFGVHTCWFGQQKPLIAFFVSPFISITVFNTLMFSHSAYIIYMIKKGMNSTQCKRKFKIYLNLALTMGITWTVGLIAMTFDNTPYFRKILWTAFNFLNAFQGVFIFMAFTCNRKVLNKFRNTLKKNISIISKMSNSSSPSNGV